MLSMGNNKSIEEGRFGIATKKQQLTVLHTLDHGWATFMIKRATFFIITIGGPHDCTTKRELREATQF